MIRSGQAVGRIKERAGGTEVKYLILAETVACVEEEPLPGLVLLLIRQGSIQRMGAMFICRKRKNTGVQL